MAAGKSSKSKKWEAEEYARQMGAEALERQTKESTGKILKKRACTCGQRARAEVVGPYHRISCPMYAPS